MYIDFPGEKYTSFSYPGGEVQVRLKPETVKEIELCAGYGNIKINARLYSTLQIVELMLLVSAIRGVDNDLNLELNIPYLPYARADRRFVPGDCFGLQVFGLLLNSQYGYFRKVRTLDVHNRDAMRRCVSQSESVAPGFLVQETIDRFVKHCDTGILTFLLPDEGAEKRYRLKSIWEHRGSRAAQVRVMSCTKKRDPETGKLLGFTVPPIEALEQNPILIVDDICDGGGTFMGIAEALKAAGHHGPMALYVTHGIFSNGALPKLRHYFERIYTTNSVAVRELPDFVEVYDAFRAMEE